MTLKIVSISVRYLFYQPMDEKIKTWTLRFPAKENPSMEKALFDWPIVLQYDVKLKYRLISRKFSCMKFFHPNVRLTNQEHSCVCIRSTNQSNRSISVRLLIVSVLFARFPFKVIQKIALTPSFFPGASFSKGPFNFRSRRQILKSNLLKSNTVPCSQNQSILLP